MCVGACTQTHNPSVFDKGEALSVTDMKVTENCPTVQLLKLASGEGVGERTAIIATLSSVSFRVRTGEHHRLRIANKFTCSDPVLLI